jgi:hypothetical protein
MTGKPRSKPKLTDAERHARFVQTARDVGASEDPSAFERAWEKVIGSPKTPPGKSEA